MTYLERYYRQQFRLTTTALLKSSGYPHKPDEAACRQHAANAAGSETAQPVRVLPAASGHRSEG